jgi:uncharacterized RDD family membrane protein YckC
MSGSQSALAGLLVVGAPVEEILDAVDREIERAEATGDAAALDRLAVQLTAASKTDESYAPLAIAAARATAVATRHRPASAAPVLAEPINEPPPERDAEPVQSVPQPAPPPAAPPTDVGAAEVAYAGFWLRLVAFAVDWVIVGVAIGLLNAVTADTEPMSLVLLFLPLAYFAGMTAFADGATVGKKMLGVAVRIDDGGTVGLGRALGRAVATAVLAFTVIGWLADVIVLGADRRKQSVHDKIAGTVVVHVRHGPAGTV